MMHDVVPLLVIISGWMGCHQVEARQEWVEQPAGGEVNPGEEAVLACRLQGKKGDCRWERNGLPVGLYAGKYEWAGSPAQGDCSLRVREASLQYDSGDWVCQVTASSFMEKDTLISSPARLLVRGKNQYLEEVTKIIVIMTELNFVDMCVRFV